MRRARTIIVRTALLGAVLGVLRAILFDRQSQRALHGAEPVVGSLDTWPEVPRRTRE
jgi:hypothetical protein